jgi:16S rRNA (uracil1498-N3)-methyltransferase
MSTPRFYCVELTPGLIPLDESESRHALQSLRLRAGDEVTLFDGRGRLAHGVLQDDDSATAEQKPRRRGMPRARRALVAIERVLCESPPDRTLTLIVAGCKGARLTWMVEKLTELGTTRVTIAQFDRSVVRVGPAHARKLRRTAIEAAKQAQRVWLPEIGCGLTLEAAVADLPAGPLLVAHPQDEATPLSSRLLGHGPRHAHWTAVVGPEGGLTEDEVRLLSEAGGELVRLSPTILRVETAAVSLAANWAACAPG